MAYLDYKVECWVRVEIDQDADLNKIIENLEKFSPYDAVERESASTNIEYLMESEEYITPEDNDGQNTIEIYNNDGQLIYENGTNNN